MRTSLFWSTYAIPKSINGFGGDIQVVLICLYTILRLSLSLPPFLKFEIITLPDWPGTSQIRSRNGRLHYTTTWSVPLHTHLTN